MIITTPEDYVAARAELLNITIDPETHKYIETHDKKRTRELFDAMNVFEKTATTYRIVCIKEFYAGQRMAWIKGDVYAKYFYQPEALNMLAILNGETMWGKGCWEIQTQ